MKRILTYLILTVTLLTVFPFAIAAKNDKQYVQRPMMTSEGHQSTAGQFKFVIDGHVGLEIPDSCYNIYITDIDKEITESDFVACVPVKNKKFHFEIELSSMKTGRIRAIMPGNKLCSAWIQIYFIPGFTVDMTVHNGFFDIHNESEYKFMTNAWLNQDAMAVLFENMGASTSGSKHGGSIEVQTTINDYITILQQLQRQMDELNYYPDKYDKERQQLLKRMDDINAKMQEVIDKYADSIKY